MLFLLFISIFSCSSNNEKKERIEYYKSWSGYSHPVRLIGKVDSFEIASLKTYYIAIFEKNNLMSVSKYSNDSILYEFIYEYDSDGKFIGKE